METDTRRSIIRGFVMADSYGAFRSWRDFYRRLHVESERDREQAAEFARRAAEVREEVTFLLRGGLTDGAIEALGALAEGDMADFCIMVDLAEGVAIPEVEPLDEDSRLHLAGFLDDDPWHSLAVDIDIPVVLAMLEEVAAQGGELRWFEVVPNLVEVMSNLLERANREQFGRFAAELGALLEGNELELPDDVAEITRFIMQRAADRLGVRCPAV